MSTGCDFNLKRKNNSYDFFSEINNDKIVFFLQTVIKGNQFKISYSISDA